MSRRQYTDEEKAAFRERDAQLAEAAEAALALPDAGARATAVALRSPKLAAYSLRNQMMLATQADKAGIELHDVDTARGWKERGRAVRKGTKAVLRIVYPIQLTSSSERDTEDQGTTLFRTRAVFEVSQTDERADAGPGPESEADPAAIWYDRLGREAAGLGLTVEHVADATGEATVAIDEETHKVTVTAADPHTPAALAALAQVLAEATATARPRTGQDGEAEEDFGPLIEFD